MCSERADEAKRAGVHVSCVSTPIISHNSDSSNIAMHIIQILVNQPHSFKLKHADKGYRDNPPASFTVENVNVNELFWFRTMPISLTILPPSSLPRAAKFGIRFNSFCVNSPIYLSYLQFRLLSLGGEIVQRALEAENGLQGALQDAALGLGVDGRGSLFVNALGMGARKVIGDEKMFPTRGQTVFVEGEAKDIIIRTGEWGIAYVIPRKGSGYTLLGGSQEAGNWYAVQSDRFFVERLICVGMPRSIKI